MMGHIFLKLSGYDAQKKFREHSVSFYTNAATFNLPKLLVENFITGMKGYYALAPYEEALHQYSVVENRSIWDYQLKLDKAQLALLKSHLYELRFVQFKYHFHSYNCASLIKELLVLVEPDIAKNSDLWTTPVDVVKHAQRAKLVAKTGVILSTQWALRSLLEVLPPTDSSDIKEAIEKKKPIPFNANSTAEKKFLMLELAKSYNNILYEQKRIGLPQWRDLNTSLLQQQSTLPKELAIEVSDDANPVNSFEDSQFTAGTLVRANKRYARIGFLPASHTLMDSQLASFNESELKLFELVLLQSLDGKDLTIDKFTLYSTRSLAPWTKVVGGISGGVKFAYENQLDQHLSSYHSLAAVGDAGFAKVIGRDITVFALAGGGVGLHRDHIFVQAASTIGVVVRELAGMKSIISIEKNWNPVGNSGSTRNLNAAQKISVTKQHAFEFAWKKTIGDSSDAQVVESSFLYKYTF